MIDWDLGVCMASQYDAQGFLGIAVDLYGEGQASGQVFEPIHPYGFISRPADPDKDENGNPKVGAGALYASEGDRKFVMPLGDPRAVAKVPQVKLGGSAQYCQPGGFAYFDGATGSYQVYVPYDNNTKGMRFAITVDTAGQECIQFCHGSGMNVTMGAQNEDIVLMSANGQNWIRIDDSGITVSGNVTVEGGALLGGSTGGKDFVTFDAFLSWAVAVEQLFATKLDGAGAPFNPAISLTLTPIQVAMKTAKVKAQ